MESFKKNIFYTLFLKNYSTAKNDLNLYENDIQM